jgi:DnaK suppressor protein
MNKEMVMKYKSLFESQKKELLAAHSLNTTDFQIQADDLFDETDLTSSELEASMKMRLRNREMLFLKKIDEALDRIATGHFGACGDCGEDIEDKRLEARPTATLCVSCKEEEERREMVHIDGHRHKSVGAKLKLA